MFALIAVHVCFILAKSRMLFTDGIMIPVFRNV